MQWAQGTPRLTPFDHSIIRSLTHSLSHSPLALIDLHGWVKLGQLFLEQLQIWIDETQLEGDGVAQLAICCGLRNKCNRYIYSRLLSIYQTILTLYRFSAPARRRNSLLISWFNLQRRLCNLPRQVAARGSEPWNDPKSSKFGVKFKFNLGESLMTDLSLKYVYIPYILTNLSHIVQCVINVRRFDFVISFFFSFFINEFSFVGRAKLTQRNAKVDWLFLPRSSPDRQKKKKRKKQKNWEKYRLAYKSCKMHTIWMKKLKKKKKKNHKRTEAQN